ncbi:Hypothetical protein R9X50_00236800 [Acrodontium crateriforme]|uniref:Histone deacetylase complex subunit SAP30 Sin3 binding domain-containing protein n=1 Tax=Acrodontium crateriforme TaxID=150365 RepID=A0AAQ3M6T7_9PEZI|nr:Hypothetical protein R9X50_00236800 [Acrodontium crateriforme]
MPPAKRPLVVQEDSRSESSTVRERQIAAAAHARKSKTAVSAAAQQQSGIGLKSLSLANASQDNASTPSQNPGMSWSTVPVSVLNTYRVAHNLSTPAAFTSPLRQAYLTNPGIGRQSPTMARRKDKRRVPRDQLALAVRKNFNSAAVSETDVVVELVYKVRHQNQTFRMRSAPNGVTKKL